MNDTHYVDDGTVDIRHNLWLMGQQKPGSLRLPVPDLATPRTSWPASTYHLPQHQAFRLRNNAGAGKFSLAEEDTCLKRSCSMYFDSWCQAETRIFIIDHESPHRQSAGVF